MKTVTYLTEGLFTVILSPLILILWLYVFIRAIVRGLGIVLFAIIEGIVYAYQYHRQ